MTSKNSSNVLKKIVAPQLIALVLMLMAVDATARDDMVTTTLRVPMLRQASDLVHIAHGLTPMEHIIGIKVDLNHGFLFISHNSKTSSREIAAMVTATGYAATVFSQNCGASRSAWRRLISKYIGN